MKSTIWNRAGFALGAIVLLCSPIAYAKASGNSLEVVSIHAGGDSKTEVSSRGGLSTIVLFKDSTILFDTGAEGEKLLRNMEVSGIDAKNIDAIVISHNQWDRLDGLSDVLGAADMVPKVYVPAPGREEILRENPQADVIAVEKAVGILPDTWLLGPLKVDADDTNAAAQVLVLDSRDGLVVIVGCSYPGVISIVEQVKEIIGHRKIQLLAGGFHLRGIKRNEIKEISLRLQTMGVKKLALGGCTSEPAIKVFRQEWGDQVVFLNLGNSVGF